MSMRITISCPHCRSRAIAGCSRVLSHTVREITYHCKNADECGHVYVAQLAIVRTLSPSSAPNPDICIPLSKRTEARVRNYHQKLKQCGLLKD